MSQSVASEDPAKQGDTMCKAILEQGANKGKQCDRPDTSNGYCGKHRKQAKLETATTSGERKCSTHRCTNTFPSKISKLLQYCSTCEQGRVAIMEKRTLCTWEEITCDKQARPSGYCGKHEPRALILIEAKKKGVRICDDGRRACRNATENFKLKCEECLSAVREKETTVYHARKKEDVCTMCGVALEKLTTGIRGHQVQKCAKCYATSRTVEEGRNTIVNYAMKNKLFPDSHYKQVMKSAADRGLLFDLTFEQFTEIVCTPCKYCKLHNDHESIGIDRVDSSKGYTYDNIVPCCTTCNMCKGSLSLEEFKSHVLKLAREFEKEDISIDSKEEIHSTQASYVRPGKIVELYVKGKLPEYIDLCKKDNRSPTFTEKLQELHEQTPKLSAIEFKRQLVNALFSETRARHLSESHDRKRIPRKELFGYMNTGNSSGLVSLYERTFGKTEGLFDDISGLKQIWDTLSDEIKKTELEKILIKYQNKRAAAAYHARKQA